MIRNSLAHVARGADGVLFFQWRQSRAGAEKYHSALVPHAGTDSRVWREVEELGRVLQRLEPVLGSRVQADVAMVMDWQAEWVCGGEATPSAEVRYRDMAAELHRELFARGLTVDVVRPGADLSGYRLVLVPTLTMVTDAAAEVLESYVRAGGHALVTYFSGIVDEHDHVRLGGYPGAFRELLGVRAEEFCPLPADGAVRLVAEDGTEVGTGRVWTEDLRLEGAKAVLSCADGPAPDAPALTRNGVGSGVAWYLATRTEGPATGAVLDQVLETAGVTPALPVPAGVETVVRRSDTGRTFTFLINHGEDDALLPVPGTDLVTGHTGDSAAVPAGGVAVVDSGPA
jgi:beta-galactosidase